MADLLRPTAGGRHRRLPGVHRPAGRLEDRGLQRRDPSKSRGPPPAPVSASVGRRAVGGPRRRPCPPCPRPRRLRPAARPRRRATRSRVRRASGHVHAVAACAGRGRGPPGAYNSSPGPCGRQRNQPVWQLEGDEGLESSAWIVPTLSSRTTARGRGSTGVPPRWPPRRDQASEPAERPGVRPGGCSGRARRVGEPAGMSASGAANPSSPPQTFDPRVAGFGDPDLEAVEFGLKLTVRRQPGEEGVDEAGAVIAATGSA